MKHKAHIEDDWLGDGVPSEVAETTAGEREVRVTELLHAFDRSTGICRCGAGPFIAAEWLAHYRAQDQPVRVTTHEGEDAGEVEACYCGGVSACLPCQERDARDAAEPDAGEVEALTCKATSFGVPTDDHVTTCGASATEEWLDLTGQWVPVCDAHGRGRGVPDDRRRPLPAEREVEALAKAMRDAGIETCPTPRQPKDHTVTAYLAARMTTTPATSEGAEHG